MKNYVQVSSVGGQNHVKYSVTILIIVYNDYYSEGGGGARGGERQEVVQLWGGSWIHEKVYCKMFQRYH